MTDLKTRDRTIEAHAYLIGATIHRFALPAGAREDVEGHLRIALVLAVDNYDPAFGVTLKSHVAGRLRWAVKEALRCGDRVKSSQRRSGLDPQVISIEAFRFAERREESLPDALRSPSAEEVALHEEAELPPEFPAALAILSDWCARSRCDGERVFAALWARLAEGATQRVASAIAGYPGGDGAQHAERRFRRFLAEKAEVAA